MSLRRYFRAAVALIAAYAVALQMILLVLTIPIAGTAAFAGQPTCLNGAVGSGSAPNAPAHDCLGVCLTGCCCGATVLSAPGPTVADVPERALPVAVALAPVSTTLLSVTAAHRSRAPPSAWLF
jgi:hypothetical protein